MTNKLFFSNGIGGYRLVVCVRYVMVTDIRGNQGNLG